MINEFRRARRRKAADTILVTDTMTERVIGHVGNLSESGMLLIANETLVDDALYQLQFALPGDKAQPETVEVGAHLLWMDRASRSEEHTSELQSLMRISYPVFSFKTQKN